MTLKKAREQANEIALRLTDEEHVYVFQIDKNYVVVRECERDSRVHKTPVYSQNGRYARLYTGE